MLKLVKVAKAEGKYLSQEDLASRLKLNSKQHAYSLLSSLVEKGELDSTTPLGDYNAERRRILQLERKSLNEKINALIFDGWHPRDIVNVHNIQKADINKAITDLSTGHGAAKFAKALKRARQRRPKNKGIPKVIEALWLLQAGNSAEEAAKLEGRSHASFLANLGAWRAQGYQIPSQHEARSSRAEETHSDLARKI